MLEAPTWQVEAGMERRDGRWGGLLFGTDEVLC